MADESVVIGTWHEEGRRVTRCPSYYAADHETLDTEPGDYPVRLVYVGGYTVPMPYWLVVGVPAVRVNGALYSGFGGVNFASEPLPPGERVTYTVQTYSYTLAGLVAQGRITLRPGYEWMIRDGQRQWEQPEAPKTWEQLDAMKEAVTR